MPSYDITLDFANQRILNTRIRVKRMDNESVALKFTFMDEGSPYDIREKNLCIRFKYSDATTHETARYTVQQAETVINTWEYALKNTDLCVEGTANAEVCIYSGDMRLTSSTFRFDIADDIDTNDDVHKDVRFPVIEYLLTELKSIVSQYKGEVEKADTLLSTANDINAVILSWEESIKSLYSDYIEDKSDFDTTLSEIKGLADDMKKELSEWKDEVSPKMSAIIEASENAMQSAESARGFYEAAQKSETAASQSAKTAEAAKEASEGYATAAQNSAESAAKSATKAEEALENKADKATTLAGYGITDAYTKEETDSEIRQQAGLLAENAYGMAEQNTSDIGFLRSDMEQIIVEQDFETWDDLDNIRHDNAIVGLTGTGDVKLYKGKLNGYLAYFMIVQVSEEDTVRTHQTIFWSDGWGNSTKQQSRVYGYSREDDENGNYEYYWSDWETYLTNGTAYTKDEVDSKESVLTAMINANVEEILKLQTASNGHADITLSNVSDEAFLSKLNSVLPDGDEVSY